MTTFKENALFRGLRAHHQYNACVGNNGGPYDLYDYAQGYFEATGILLVQAMKPGMLIDILVYPICLSFRHAVELYIKYLISDLAKVSGAKENFRKNHSLEDNWKIALKMIRNSALRTTMKQRAKMQEIVESIAEVDQTGEVFRYPESIKEDQHLKNWSVINLLCFWRNMKQLTRLPKHGITCLRHCVIARGFPTRFESEGFPRG